MALQGVNTITTESYAQMLRHAMRTSANLMAFGIPGIGKTEIPYQIAKEMNVLPVYINLSVMQPPDLLGLPRIDADGRVSYAAPRYMPVWDQTEHPVLLVVDEVDKADSEMTSPFLEILQSHSLGGNKLKIQAIVATGNMPDDNSYSKPISHALANRCMVFQIEPNFERWREWALSANINPLVIGFLGQNADYFIRRSKTNDPTEYAKCSPRSWSNAARQIDQADPNASVDYLTLLISGYVGLEASVAFRVWLEHYRNLGPIIDRLLAGENVGELDIDKTFVLGLSALGRIMQMHRAWESSTDQKTKTAMSELIQKTATNVFTWLATIPPNFQFGMVKAAFHQDVAKSHKLSGIRPVMAVYNNIHNVLTGR